MPGRRPPVGELAYTRLARDEEAAWITRRVREAYAELGNEVLEEDGRLVIAADSVVSSP
jgi:hypothetical protein